MDSNLVHSLAQAIGILFGNEAGWTQEQKHKANTFILEANNRKDVFPALLTILMDQSYSLIIQFFACNLLNDKLRKQWGQLLVQEQSEVVDRLGHLVLHTLPNLMSHSSEATAYRGRLVLAFCSACVRSAVGVTASRSVVATLLNKADANCFIIAMTILKTLNEELEQSDLSRHDKVDLQAAFSQDLSTHLQYLERTLPQHSSQSPQSEAILAASLGFIGSCCTAKSLTLKVLSGDYPNLFSILLASLLPPLHPTTFQLACAACRDLAVMREYPSSAQSQKALEAIAQRLTAATNALLPLYHQDGYQSTSILTCMVDLCESIVVVISVVQELIVVEGHAVFQELAKSLIALISQRPRSLAMLTFDLWADLENFSDDERALFFTPVLLKELFPVMLNLLCPLESTDPDTFDEDEDRETFRDLRLGIDEILCMCCESLPDHFFQSLAHAVDSSQSVVSPFILEAVLFVLHASMSRIKTRFGQDQRVITFLLHCGRLALMHVASLPAQGRETLSQFLGSLAFLFTRSTAADLPSDALDLFALSLSWTLRCGVEHVNTGHSGSTTLAETAAKAFHRLLLCSPALRSAVLPSIDLFNSSATCLENVLQFFVSRYHPVHCRLEASQTLVEALVRAIVSLESLPEISRLLSLLGQPVVEGFNRLLTSPPSARSVEEADHLLAYLSQMIRFCDAAALSQPSHPHAATPLLLQVWPLLDPLCSHLQPSSPPSSSSSSHHQHAGRLPAQVFLLYGRVLQALGLHARDLAPVMAQRVLAYLDSPGTLPAAAAAYDCAATIMDYFVNQLPETLTDDRLLAFLAHLIQSMDRRLQPLALSNTPTIFVSIADPMQAMGMDLEGLDGYARCLLAAISSPRIRLLLDCSRGQVAEMVQTLVSCTLSLLRICAEKDPLRNLHALLQTLFSPSKLSLNFPDSSRHQHLLIQALSSQGGPLVTVLVLELSSSRLGNIVVGNVAEALAAVLGGLCAEGCGEFSKAWLNMALTRQDALAETMDAAFRARLGVMMMILATHQPRRFKAMAQDVYKVCCSEAEVDVLAGYEDVLQG